MANKITIELSVDDKGSAVIKQFGQTSGTALKETDAATKGLANSTAGLASTSKSSFDQIRGQWLAITAAAAGAVAIAKSAIGAFMEEEAAQMKLAVAMRNQGDFSREAFAALKDYAAQMQKTTVYGDEAALATMANLKTYGMTTEELKRATQASLDLATAKGMDLLSASELVGKAFVGETGTLSRYGIIVDEGVGKTQKFDAVLGQIQQRFGGAAQAEIETYAGKWKQISNWWGDQMEKAGLGLLKTIEAVQLAVGMLGVAFYTVLEKIAGGLRWLVEQAEKIPVIGEKFAGMADHLRTIEGGFAAAKEGALQFTDQNYKMITSFDNVEKAAEKMGNAQKAAARESAEEIKAANERMLAAAKLRLDEETNLTKYFYEDREAEIKNQEKIMKLAGAAESEIMRETISRKTALIEEYRQAEERLIALAAAARSADERKKISDAEFTASKLKLLAVDVQNKRADIARQELALEAQTAKEVREIHQKATDDAIDLMEKEIAAGVQASKETIERLKKEAEEREKLRENRMTAERDMYSDLRGYDNQYYDATKALIDKQAQDYRDLGIDEAAIAAWVADQHEQNQIKMGQASDDFVLGVNAGLLEMERNAMTFGRAGYDIFNTFATESQKALSDVLFQGIKTGTIDAQAVWTSFNDAMLRKFTDTLAQMVIEAAAKDVAMLFRASWSSDSSAVLGLLNKGLDFILGGGADSFGADTTGDWMAEFNASHYRGGRIDGAAGHPGDSPANDTVLGWLSPGEYVVPRTAVNADTIGALEYIRRHRRAPAYAEGGYVGLPQLGYGDSLDQNALNLLWLVLGNTGGNLPYMADFQMRQPTYGELTAYNAIVRGWTETPDLSAAWDVLGGGPIPTKRTPVDMYGWVDAGGYLANIWTGHITPYGETTAMTRGVPPPERERSWGLGPLDFLGDWIAGAAEAVGGATDWAMHNIMGNPVFEAIAEQTPILAQAMIAAAATATGQPWAAALMMGQSGFITSGGDWRRALVQAAMAYFVTPNKPGGFDFGDVLATAGKKYALNLAISKLAGVSGAGVDMNFEYLGADDGGMLANLSRLMGDIAPQSYGVAMPAVSARSGLDYVPRDNFLIRGHEGEAVLTADEARSWRGGADSGELAAEIRALRKETQAGNKSVGKITKILERFDIDGLPAVRTV